MPSGEVAPRRQRKRNPARARRDASRVTAVVGRTRERIRALEREIDHLATSLWTHSRRPSQIEDEVRRLRMQPITEIGHFLSLAVREVAQETGKTVQLVLEGGQTEVDRAIMEALKDPLLHLVRNAVDHGVESPSRREELGKSARARVVVSAQLSGSQVRVSVSDDGRGLDLDAIRSKARDLGLAVPEGDDEVARLVFQPGFTTAARLTHISGRGVGLDVVKSRVESMHGTIDLSWVRGQSTRFDITVPLTLTTIRALLVRCEGHVFAFACTSVRRVLRASARRVRRVEMGWRLFEEGDHESDSTAMSVAWLGRVLGLTIPVSARSPGGHHGTGVDPEIVGDIIVTASGHRDVALIVDEVLGEQEILVKPLGPRLAGLAHLGGATLLPSGQIVLLLSMGELMRMAVSATAPRPRPRGRILVVDDSPTTRMMQQAILESAGYEVLAAIDGCEAWALMMLQGVDLVMTDVDMPNRDGVELTLAIRADARFAGLPIILVTGMEDQEDLDRFAKAGANRCLPKSVMTGSDLVALVRGLLVE